MTGPEPGTPRLFQPRTAAILAWGILGLLMVTLFFLIFAEPESQVQPGQPDSYSRSAIGYQALYRLLDRDVSVLISRRHSATKVSERVPLLLLEPRHTPESVEQLRNLTAQAVGREAPVVLVLPKWRGTPGPDPQGWIEEVQLEAPVAPNSVLSAVLDCAFMGCSETELGGPEESASERPSPESPSPRTWNARVERPEGLASWSSALPQTSGLAAPALVAPQVVPVERLAPEAGLESLGVEILLGTSAGVLAFHVADLRLTVVTDPDLLNTSGLHRGDNALYAHRLLVDRLQPTSFVIAEEIHGYATTPSIWRALLRPPLVLVTLQLAALAVLVLWTATGRFGRALPVPPRVARGKGTLIENTALLLRQGNHFDESMDRYLQWTVRRAHHLFNPYGFNPYGEGSAGPRPHGLRQQVARLARLGERRGVTVDLDRVARGVVTLAGRGKDPRRALSLARQLYRWRKEMEDG